MTNRSSSLLLLKAWNRYRNRKLDYHVLFQEDVKEHVDHARDMAVSYGTGSTSLKVNWRCHVVQPFSGSLLITRDLLIVSLSCLQAVNMGSDQQEACVKMELDSSNKPPDQPTDMISWGGFLTYFSC